jgi:hypothetical protein
LLVFETLAWSALLICLSATKFVLPFRPVRRRLDPILDAIANASVSCVDGIFGLKRGTNRRADQATGASDAREPPLMPYIVL